ncbi:MAG: trimethylamine--corrinoid methyltransferase [Candidatus Moduliflexus flocculans]|nr:trimethylamine--corrinoid methyltransferase [Candidatus Moduliflexus flocculans]
MGKKPEEDGEEYEAYEIEDHPELKCWIKRDVLAWMARTTPTPEGDYLFAVEGAGRSFATGPA